MEKILQGISRVIVYIDDMLVTGRSDEEHLEILEQVLAHLQEYGLHLKKEKCLFMRPSVEYLGYIVNKDGLLRRWKQSQVPPNPGMYLNFDHSFYRSTLRKNIFAASILGNLTSGRT